jgi:hypothetical protein
MKTTSLILVLSVLLAAASGAFAEEKAKDAKHAAKEKNAPKAKVASTGQYVTGSYIKQKLNRDGQITDGPSPLVVFDQQAIERSGASDLRQLLVRRGASR